MILTLGYVSYKKLWPQDIVPKYIEIFCFIGLEINSLWVKKKIFLNDYLKLYIPVYKFGYGPVYNHLSMCVWKECVIYRCNIL